MIPRLGSGLLAALSDSQLAKLGSAASEVSVVTDEILFAADTPADSFFVVRTGVIVLELEVAGAPPLVITSVGEGDLLGLSWLFPPFIWKWTARAAAPSVLLSFDARAVRSFMEEDHELGYRVMRAAAAEMKSRLTGARLQLLDLYGSRR